MVYFADFLWLSQAIQETLPDAYHGKKKKKPNKKVERASGDTKPEQESTIDPGSPFLLFFVRALYPSAIWSDARSACHDKCTKSHNTDTCDKRQVQTGFPNATGSACFLGWNHIDTFHRHGSSDTSSWSICNHR